MLCRVIAKNVGDVFLRHSVYQLNSVEGHAKCPAVSQRREIMTGTRAAGQGSK